MNAKVPDLQCPELTPKQELAMAALLTGATFIKAGEAAGVNECTVRRWYREETFKRVYARARSESYSLSVAAVVRLVPMAVVTLAKAMTDPGTPQAVKVQAASHAMRYSREAIELEELSRRVEALEAAQQLEQRS